MTRDHIAASVANDRESLFDRSRGTRSFDGDVGTLAVCQFAYGRCSRFDDCRRDVEDDIGSHRPAERQPLGRSTDQHDRRRPAEARECDDAEADGAGTLDNHGVARPERRPLEHVDSRQQPASAADVVVEPDFVREPGDPNARFR